MVRPVVRLHVRPSGERLPILVDQDTGVPLLLPSIYVMTALRSRAANTIAQHLIGVQILLLWCRIAGVALEDRIRSGALFRAHELDALWDATARQIADLNEAISSSERVSPKVVKLGRKLGLLARETVANRRGAVRRYLDWLTERQLFALGHQPHSQQSYRVAREELLSALEARGAGQGRQSEPREGLHAAERIALLRAIDPDSEANPWRGAGVRQRNLLMISLFFQLGLRRGELLALRVEDVDLQKGQLHLIRRSDDVRDSRARQPVLKTEERLLDLRADVVDLMSIYILEVRVLTPLRARQHGYLFVNLRTGAELSASSIEKMFHRLRDVPGVSPTLTCHVLRHDWNERFSAAMDEAGVAPELERQIRRYLQGWRSEASASAYTRRHIRARANEALTQMQQRFAPSRGAVNE